MFASMAMASQKVLKWVGKGVALAAVAVAQEDEGEEETQDDGNDRGFGAEGSARNDFGAVDGGGKDGFVGIAARDGEAEDVALSVVPCPMDADGDPQGARPLVDSTQQQSRLDGNGE